MTERLDTPRGHHPDPDCPHVPAAAGASREAATARFPTPASRAASALALAWALLALGWLSVRLPLLNDDAFITFRVARNLADGKGMVYNPGDRVQVSSTPLYCLLLAATRRATGWDVVTAARAWEFVFLAAGVLLLWWIVVLSGYAGWAWLVPLLAATEPVIVLFSRGMESAPFMLFVLAALLALGKERPAWASVFLAGAVLTRLDGLILAALIGLVRLGRLARKQEDAREWLRTCGLQAALFAALAGPWFAFAWFYFGHPLPVTIAHKMSQSRALGFPQFAETFVQEFVWDSRLGLPRMQLVPFAVGAAAWLWRAKPKVRLVEWWVLYLAVYVLARMPFYLWYQFPLYLPAAALVPVGVAELFRWVERPAGRRTVRRLCLPVAVLAVLAVQIARPARDIAITAAAPDDSALRDTKCYRAVGRYLAAQGPPESVVAAFEVGLIGYYSGWRVLDLTGLTTPLPDADRRASSLNVAMRELPEAVVLEDKVYYGNAQETRSQFEARYEQKQVFDDPNTREKILIFARRGTPIVPLTGL